MRFAESVLPEGTWASAALVQVTLIALLGCLAWLAARRTGPALRGAILLAALVAVLLAPAVASVAPVWLPLPEWFCRAGAEPLNAPSDGVPLPPPSRPVDPAVFALLVTQPPAKAQPNADDSTKQTDEIASTPVKAEAVLIDLTPAPEDAVPPVDAGKPSRPSWSLASLLAALWMVGAVVFLARALVRLALLYRCLGQARAVRDRVWIDGVASLAKRHNLPAIALRESRRIASPLALGLLRPAILLPRGRRGWSAAQRLLILEHEVAHIRRRDFLTGLMAELAMCLCWFHPLVRWLAGRLRLEQEYAADAWVASATGDPTDYVRWLARLALELDRGRGSLAPAFWRRRPEILRRIDMLRRNPEGLPTRLGKRAGWTVALLTSAACLVAASVGPLHSAADGQKPTEVVAEAKGKAGADWHGDPLPAGARARLGTTRLRHGTDVTFVAFGPKGETLFTADRDNTIHLWDLSTGKEVRRFVRPKPAQLKAPEKGNKDKEKQAAEVMMQLMAGGGNGRNSFRVALSPDGQILAADCGNFIQLWKVETGEELRRITMQTNRLGGLLFSPDGRMLAARATDGTLLAWVADTGKEIRRIKPTPRPMAKGNVLIIGNGGGGGASGMAFTPDSKVLAAAATDYKEQAATASVKFWDLATGKEVRKIETPENVAVSVVAIAPDGKVAAYGGGDTVHLCDVKTGQELRQFKTPGGVQTLTFAPDGKTLAVGGANQRVGLWEVQTGKELHRLSDAQPARRTGGGLVFFVNGFSSPEMRTLAFSPDGKQVAAAAGSTIRVWETATGKDRSLPEGHRQTPSALVLARDGKTALSWGADRVVRRWETATGKPLGAFPAPAQTTLAALSPDARIVALANADNTIRLHDAATGKELHRLKAHENGTANLTFTRDGKMLASRGSADNSIRLYDVTAGGEARQIALTRQRNADGEAVLVLGGSGGNSSGAGAGLTFSPDGKLLVVPRSGGNPANTLVFFDVASGKELRKIELPQAVRSLAFAPDGRTLATENTDRTTTLWEVASGKERERLGEPVAARQPNNGGMGMTFVINGMGGGNFTEPAGPVGVVFSPDGRALAVRGADPTVHIWDVAAGKEIGQFKGHSGRIETLAFAADGKTLASGAADTTILLWDAASPLKGLAKMPAAELSAAETEALWGDLARDDAAKALRGVRKLTAASRQTVAFLGERLKPAARIDPRKIDGWIGELESEKFAVRQSAATNLLKSGEQVMPALRKVLASSPPLETRKRVEDLLEKLTGGTLTAEQLRLVRAVEALEGIGTPEARQVLRTLAQGAPGSLPTREAEAALSRLAGPRP